VLYICTDFPTIHGHVWEGCIGNRTFDENVHSHLHTVYYVLFADTVIHTTCLEKSTTFHYGVEMTGDVHCRYVCDAPKYILPCVHQIIFFMTALDV
jgi:hypothetical protein